MAANETVEAFEVLGNETRMAIISALAEERRKSPGNLPLTFSELRGRTEIGDSGRFNYHLDKLLEHFIEETENGYDLNRFGRYIVSAVISGYYEGDTVEIDGHELEPCPLCEETLKVEYRDGRLQVGCSNDHKFKTWLPPRAFEDRTIESVVELGAIYAIEGIRQIQRGSCPLCFGHVEWELITIEDAPPDFPTPVEHSGRCQVCGQGYGVPPGMFAILAPRVQAEMGARAINKWVAPVRWLIGEYDETIDSFDTSTGRVTVTKQLDSVSLTITIDERGAVQELDIHEAGST